MSTCLQSPMPGEHVICARSVSRSPFEETRFKRCALSELSIMKVVFKTSSPLAALRPRPPSSPPYETFLQYVAPQEFRARRASSAQLSSSLPRKLSLSDIQAALSPRDAAFPFLRNIEADFPDFIGDALVGKGVSCWPMDPRNPARMSADSR
ncbi:hypothetical protein C8J57DRAFT_1468837 [Mycena rebaudengoi]|nr:hypothetical protein C8J57DRAFT_1468837 [Mycena rebaudengoi]